ncbi:MAG: DUF1800 family protein [Verrucomicrobiota bacterium]
MSAPIHPVCVRPLRIALFLIAGFIGLPPRSQAQVDPEINKEVWKQKYGVLDAQMDQLPPYAGWLDQDADGDGVENRSEFLAGTNPFKKLPTDANFRPPEVAANPSTLSLTFPTVPGKLYGAESSESLVDAWSKGTLPSVTGDGTDKTLVVPKSAGKFFHITVTDQATQGDQVSDWAKHVLGYSMGSPIHAQTGFTHTSLAANLQQQNLLTLAAIDTAGTQPSDNTTPAGDYGLIRVTRSGHILVGDITVPLTKTGTAVEGVDYAPLPASVTFPAGVNSLDIRITPLFNAGRTSSATVFLAASAPENSAADGNYTLGTPSSAGVTLYPANNPAGTGLTGNYYNGSNAAHTHLMNFGGLAANYVYTKASGTSGTAIITYSGTPVSPIAVGTLVRLQFTSNTLNVAPYNTPTTYTVIAPVTATSFAVAITGTAVPNNSSGTPSVVIGSFNGPVTRSAPNIDFTWGNGNPNGNASINADNYSVVWQGFLSPATTGNYTFRLDADDRARVLIDTGAGFQQILENGWDTAATGGYKLSQAIALTIPAAPANRYPIRVEFAETTGSSKCKLQWQINSGSFTDIPQTVVFTDNTGTTTNWNGTYYNNSTFTLPVAKSQPDAASITGGGADWLTGSPDPLIFHNNFSTRWFGQVLPQYSQTYFFVAKANEGSKVWINNQLIIDKWSGSSGSDQTGSIALQAGVLYDLRMESYEVSGTSEAHLSWYSQDQAKQIVPTNRLFPTSTGTTPLAGNPPAGLPAITSPTNPVFVLGSSPSFSLPLTGSNGGTFTASGLPPWLTLVNGVLSGTPPAAGIYQFTLTTTNSAGSGSVVLTLEVLAAEGTLTRELWTTGVTGPALANVPWTNTPSSSDTITTAEDTETTYAANTGERLRGYFTAPATGNYYFWIAASNVAELWISNDSEAVNKVRRAYVTGPAGTAARTWDAQPNQKSQWLSLTAGKKYYLEALHNTGASGSGNHLSVAWFLDPTGNTPGPIANNSPPAAAVIGGILPGHSISPWDNPPTTTVPGTLYVTNLQGAAGLNNITGTGGSFLRVNGSTAVLQLNYSGLTSGMISKKIYDSADQVIFDIGAQEKNYPALKTSDGGHTWNMQASDLAALNNGGVRIEIATINHPGGELSGTFGKTAGSQTAPAVPASPAWPDQHASSDAANSRFLSQATFGPSPADMAEVKANGYRPWIESQFTAPITKNVPYILENLSADPQNPYGSTLMFNSWWKNSVTAPDQLRQRAAFALSEILVVSDTGPLNNNGRVLADYYDTLLDYSFGNFRDILKQVTLSPAMGVYLDMRANAAGSIITGLHPNENYAREILQLFSAGLYRTWPDSTLILDSKGNAVPTYDQSVITGMARVFTGWNWGQALQGSGRLPTSFSPGTNYLDPMVLVPARHESGSKILLDNVILPPATNTDSATTLTDSNPISIQTTDPVAGPGNLVTTPISNQYDLNGLKDLEATLDNIMANSAVGPYICRQLIQRLVTSHPKPEYIHRVVLAFNGERNVDGTATGVRGDMKEVFRAILLDHEARSTTAAADPKFGKQREPLLRVTGPARAFPAANFPNSTYAQSGSGSILITTPSNHRLISGDSVRLSNFVDSGGSSSQLPTTQTYQIGNVTPNSFTVNNNATSTLPYTVSGNTAVIDATGLAENDRAYLKFTTGGLAGGTYDGIYTIGAPSGAKFTVTLASAPASTTGGSCLVPKLASGYNVTTTTGVQTITIQTSGSHNLTAGDSVQLKFLVTNTPLPAANGVYAVTSVSGPNSFKVTPPVAITNGSQGSSSVTVYPLKGSQWTRNGTVHVQLSTWGIGTTPTNLNQTPLNSTTVFNFFYPDYQYPGPMAQAGMTTPEFQLTNDSNTMNLTNLITQGTLTNNNGNTAGYITFFGSNSITLDLAPYMTAGQTSDANIPALIDSLSVLLIGDNLSGPVKTAISSYVANTVSYPYTTPAPTATQMRDRVRAIVHLIVTSAEYAIQK